MKNKSKDTDTTVIGTAAIESLQVEDTFSVAKNYVPEGFDSIEDYLSDMRETYAIDLEADQDNRDEALDDKMFTAGEQWDPVVKEYRKGLPCLTINTIPQFVAQVVGDWRTNRNAIKVIPAENGDVDVASIRGDLVRAIEMKSRAPRVYDSAFESTIQCGDGAFRVAVEYARDDVFDQEIFVRPIDDVLSVVWDHLSVDPTGRDATHCFVDDVLPKNEFEKRFKDASPSTLSDDNRRDLRASGWCDDQTVRVTEHWRMIQRTKLLALFQDGAVHEMTAESAEELITKHGTPVRYRSAPCRYAQMHLVTGWEILAGPFEYRLNRLPIIRLCGRVVNIGGRKYRYGLVRNMKEPVRLKNFHRSIAAEQLGYAPKAQWLAPASAVEGREPDFRKAHISRDPLLVYNDDAVAPPERIDPPQMQAALHNEAAINTQDMKDVTGIHDASLGIKSNETSGRAIQARQREGDIANIVYHDNGNAAILEAGDVINQLIPQIYDGTRIIRIVGEDQEAKFVRINDPYDPEAVDLSSGLYDVALSTGTSYMTRRVEAAEAMMEAVQVWPEMMQIAGDLVAKAQDWPGAQELAERLKKTIPPQLLGPDEQEGAMQPQGQMLTPEMMQQAQQMEEELKKLKEENTAFKLDRQIDWYKAQTDRIKALSDHEVDMNQMEQDAIAKILDARNADEDRTLSWEQGERQAQLQEKKDSEAAKAKPARNTTSDKG